MSRIEAQATEAGKAPAPELLRHYVYLAVKSGEVARTNPYKSSISTANSGLAFGNMQSDTGAYAGKKMAQEYFRKILDADVISQHLKKAKAAVSIRAHSADTKLASPTVPVDRVLDQLGGILN